MGLWNEAFLLCKDILEKTEEEHGKADNEYAAALNKLALIYEISGHYC